MSESTAEPDFGVTFPSFDYAALLAQYGPFWPWLVGSLFRHDLMRLNFTDNNDEYEAEAADILTRLPNLHTAAEVAKAAHEVFTHWFDGADIGDEAAYARLGEEIWMVWTGGPSALLDAIPGALEQAQHGRDQIAKGEWIPLEDL